MADGMNDVESSLQSDLQALLKQMNSRSSFHTGRLRWTFEKQVESDPSCSAALIPVIIKELETKLKRIEKIEKTRSYMHIIPLLHTLYYVAIQSGSAIPSSLHHSVYDCLMKLLILPLPYSAVALSTLRSLRMEMTRPGSLCLKRLVAEKNLKTEHFTSQEIVFVLADPAVFSTPLEATVRAFLDLTPEHRDSPTVQRNLMLHVLQKGLGTACQSSRLAQALQASGDQTVEKHFHKVVLATEQSMMHGAGGAAAYMNGLQHIYRDILTACKEETGDDSSVCSTAMPFPEISFHLWKDEEDLWNLLANNTLRSSAHEAEKNNRDSIRSEDSGIVRDLKVSDTDQPPVSNVPPPLPPKSTRRKKSAGNVKNEASKEDRNCLTARMVVMGDNRVLGKLAKAYHFIRQRESKHQRLTKKLDLQLYYIPIMDMELSTSSPDSPCQEEGGLSLSLMLGRVDPWYDNNINSLGAMISKLPETQQSNHSQSSQQRLFLLDSLCYYLRCGTQPVNLPVYSVKMTRCCCDVTTVEEEMFVSHLEAEVPEFKHLKVSLRSHVVFYDNINYSTSEPPSRKLRRQAVKLFGAVISVSYTAMSLSRREVEMKRAPMIFAVVMTSEPTTVKTGEDCLSVKFNSLNPELNTEIQTQRISIKTMEQRILTLRLDRDSRRTFTDIQRLEVSPCSDPGQRFTIRNRSPLLSLPINTFTGVAS